MITDICIFIAIIFFSVHGFKKGFIKSVYSLLSVFATLFLLYILKDYFINEVSKTELGVAIGNFFSGNDEFDFITQRISTAVISFVSTLILYIFIKFILKFVLKIIDSLSKLPLIKSINKILGLVSGFAFGAMWIIIILNILYIFPDTSNYILDSKIASFFNLIVI